MRNNTLIEKVVEITVAKISGTDAFMQEIYDKLVELNKNDD